MKLKDKIKFIVKVLDSLYPKTEIPLSHTNNFTFLVAVMLSAQSTDKKVNEITPFLFAKADSAKKMDSLTELEIRNIIRQIGLAPTKAKNIKLMSALLLLKHEGKVPNTFKELEDLPGVGHKLSLIHI